MVPRCAEPVLAVSESAIRFPEARVSTCDNRIDVPELKGSFFGAKTRPKVLLEKFAAVVSYPAE